MMRLTTNHPTRKTNRRQRGAVLMISLIFLLIISLLGITSMSSAILEEKMARNDRDLSVALRAAESAIRAGNTYLRALMGSGIKPETMQDLMDNGLPADTLVHRAGTWSDDAFKQGDTTFWQSNGVEYGDAGIQDLEGTATDPYYVIEEMPTPAGWDGRDSLVTGSSYEADPRKEPYLITAAGQGPTGDARAIVQTVNLIRIN